MIIVSAICSMIAKTNATNSRKQMMDSDFRFKFVQKTWTRRLGLNEDEVGGRK
jgi:hypothetical protein